MLTGDKLIEVKDLKRYYNDGAVKALDAVELMNVGVQFLHEHMTEDCRIHYAITDAGGISPNVVQSKAAVLYMVRANKVADSVKLQARVDDIAKGAALTPGSTDVGDVSWQTPTAQVIVAAWPAGVPGHSWQIVSCGKTSLAHKALNCAGKVIASAAIELINDPALLQKAKDEHADGYVCPIEKDAVPIAI